MDPVTAFSIACGVIQVVDFGFKITRKIWTIVRSSSGTSAEYEELEAATSTLQDLIRALKAQNEPATLHHTNRAVQDSGDVAVSSSTAQAIRQIASQCDETARKLIELLSEIKVDPTKYKSTRSRTFKAIKAIPKFYKISKLESQLEEYQEKLEKHIILDLRQTSRALLDGTIEGFKNLQAEHKDIVAAIANNESSIAKLIMAEGGKIRGEISAVGRKLDDAEYREKLRMFVESFAFDDMFERENRIGRQPAAPKTFRWLFDKSESGKGPYDSFTDWLEGDQGIYWICGKAGSGKSTLMSFIWDHPDSKKDGYLQKWSANNELIIAAVFFWHKGSELQKSSVGLIRSLLYQILKKNESRAGRIMEMLNISQGANQSWSEARLLPLLFSVFDDPDIRVCLFIDGLDEYGSGDVNANNGLLKIVTKLTACANGRLKCCLSSRPLRSFELGLEQYPKLMLHKLNRPDITHYVTHSLGDVEDRSLIEETVDKADGVFLWVFFAVKSLQAAQINGDTRDQIQRRLNELPSELDDLYSHMLLKIERVYWKDAALYLALASLEYFKLREISCYESEDLSVLHCVIACKDSYFEELTLPWTPKRIRALRKDCANMEKWLKVRTAGLLEVAVGEHIPGRDPLGLRVDDLRVDDLSIDGAAKDGVSDSQVADSGKADLPGTDASPTDLEIYYDLLELRRDTELTLKSEAIVNGPSDEKAIEQFLRCRRIIPIHRSVTQFLENNKENEIFSLLPEATAWFKRIQADIVISTFSKKIGWVEDLRLTHRNVQGLMGAAAQAEARTRQPNRLYVDKLGSALKTLKGPEWPASEPENFATTFLGFTAEHGLNLYVQDCLKINPPTGKENRQSVLNDALRCVTSDGLREREHQCVYVPAMHHLELITFLLNEGADPNDAAPRRLALGNMTAWEAFLGPATGAAHRTNLSTYVFPNVLKRFVACGADHHQEYVFTLNLNGPKPWCDRFECILRANAAFALEQYGLPCDPVLPRATVEEMVWRNVKGKRQGPYVITKEGSVMLIDAILVVWKTRSSKHDNLLARRECYRRCIKVRKSAHDPDYAKPPLAEHYTKPLLAAHYTGGLKPMHHEEGLRGDFGKWPRQYFKEWLIYIAEEQWTSDDLDA